MKFFRYARSLKDEIQHIYVIEAANSQEALQEMKSRFPDDERGFTIHAWGKWESVGGYSDRWS